MLLWSQKFSVQMNSLCYIKTNQFWEHKSAYRYVATLNVYDDPAFLKMKWLLSPSQPPPSLDEMLVHRKVALSSLSPIPIYTPAWVKRDKVEQIILSKEIEQLQSMNLDLQITSSRRQLLI